MYSPQVPVAIYTGQAAKVNKYPLTSGVFAWPFTHALSSGSTSARRVMPKLSRRTQGPKSFPISPNLTSCLSAFQPHQKCLQFPYHSASVLQAHNPHPGFSSASSGHRAWAGPSKLSLSASFLDPVFDTPRVALSRAGVMSPLFFFLSPLGATVVPIKEAR